MSERGKPWVGWMDKDIWRIGGGGVVNWRREGTYNQPVVMTPVLEGDPLPGEIWLSPSGKTGIVGAPYPYAGVIYVPTSHGPYNLSRLTRVPEEKTYRLPLRAMTTGYDDPADGMFIQVRATSREDALAKLAEALEEAE